MQTSTRILLALFDGYSRSFPVTRAWLAEALCLAPATVERALVELERAECVDAARLRLTMQGLALAAACAAEIRARRRARRSAQSRPARQHLAA